MRIDGPERVCWAATAGWGAVGIALLSTALAIHSTAMVYISITILLCLVAPISAAFSYRNGFKGERDILPKWNATLQNPSALLQCPHGDNSTIC